MKLTREKLEAAYEFLCEFEPFCDWPLPDHTEVVFRVIRSNVKAADAGKLADGRWCIRINQSWCGKMQTLLRSMMHEMCHVAHGEACPSDQAHHGKWFLALADQVCQEHLIDPKAF